MRFFFDNNLSSHLAGGMKEFGEDVVHLRDHFPENATDAEWLPFVGDNDLVLITRDDAIRWNPAERRHKVAAFFLGGKKLSRCQLIQQLVRNWPRMKELAASEKRPFAFRVPPHGTTFNRLAL
jgi:predicted nuclease of predicted toxin-antitoxin system